MESNRLNYARNSVPDCVLNLIDERNPNITKIIYANRFILASVSEPLKNIFYSRGSHPEEILLMIEKKGWTDDVLAIVKDFVFPKRNFTVLDVELFSQLIDSFYKGDTVSFIIKQESAAALTLLSMCDQYIVHDIPYMNILKTIQPSNECFHQFIDFLHRIDELDDKNIILISNWIDKNTDLSVIEDEIFVNKLIEFRKHSILLLGNRGLVGRYSYQNGKMLETRRFASLIRSEISVSRLGIAALCGNNSVIIIRTDTLDIIDTIVLPSMPCCVSFSPDGDRLAVSCKNRGLYLYNSPGWTVSYSVFLEDLPADNICWSPNDQFIALVSCEKACFLVLNSYTLEVIYKSILLQEPWEDIIYYPGAYFARVKFSGDGQYLAYTVKNPYIEILSAEKD